MTFKHLLHSPSGRSLADCCFLGQRFDADRPFSPYDSESWLLCSRRASNGSPTLSATTGICGWYTMLWRAPSGTAYVSEADNRVWWSPQPWELSSWQSVEVPAFLRGIWGTDDGCVFTWGVKGGVEKMFRFDGSIWTEMPSPGEVARLHGLSPEFVIAVGPGGLLARWDGRAWQRVPVPTTETLTGVFVVSADEYYACGEGGSLFSGSGHGVRERARGPGPLTDVAVFKGSVWVGAGTAGLLRLQGTTDELEVPKPNLHALSFDVRGDLLIGTSTKIAASADGAAFFASPVERFAAAVASIRPLWLP